MKTTQRPGVAKASLEAPVVEGTGRRHVLDLDDFSRVEIEELFHTTEAMKEILHRDIRKVPALRGKTVATLFLEASTRTRLSFEQAARVLSADVANLGSQGSSIEKGESLYNTAKTLQSLGVDMIVIRHPHAGAPYLLARCLEASVINAGDGWHAHPTQALLDLYTIWEQLHTLEGLKVVILGDVLHSRVARSNLWGLAAMGARVVLCGPPTLLPPPNSRQEGYSLPAFQMETRVEKALGNADVVMVLRLQLERQRAGLLPSLREYARLYQLDEERLTLAKPGALVMHPGPINEGVEISSSVAHGAQSLIQTQVANGVAMRMALLYTLGTGGGRGGMTGV